MTEEKQRIAIAEICGTMKWSYALTVKVVHCDVPKYDSLDDIHDAEKMLEGAQRWNRYTDELGKVCHYKPAFHDLRSFANIIVSATAAQRREAFLRTFNRWEE